ncbi:hypothetical protein Hanom_Chr06g00523101 [Helianthus anomalus]
MEWAVNGAKKQAETSKKDLCERAKSGLKFARRITLYCTTWVKIILTCAHKKEVEAKAVVVKRDTEIVQLNVALSEHENVVNNLASQKKDLTAKDVETAKLKCRLLETQEKCESLELDVGAEKACVEAVEEARDTIQSSLSATQDARYQIETMVETLKNNYVRLQQCGIAHESVTNVELNSVEFDTIVATLTVTTCKDGYREGYQECVSHVNKA